ncbi:MAG: energy transducer TonB [Burkholderiales bacterium PBB3]|nr:MAG: energy transducer TonB [Burkholderiales bacterium PBB3]
MAALSNNRVYHPHGTSRLPGMAVVIGVHLLLAYGLVNGLHRDIVQFAKPTVTLLAVTEVEIPPLILPPKPTLEPLSKQITQEVPPVRIVQSEVNIEPTTQSVVVETGTPMSQASTTAPVAAAQPLARSTAPVDVSIGTTCHYMVVPEMPRKAVAEGAAGVVRATALIKDGVVIQITQLSGPRIFYPAVKAAMLQYRCNVNAGEVTATQEFHFKLND